MLIETPDIIFHLHENQWFTIIIVASYYPYSFSHLSAPEDAVGFPSVVFCTFELALLEKDVLQSESSADEFSGRLSVAKCTATQMIARASAAAFRAN